MQDSSNYAASTGGASVCMQWYHSLKTTAVQYQFAREKIHQPVLISTRITLTQGTSSQRLNILH
jgi:hypothetical protein